MSVVQIMQDVALCREKFPSLICRAMAAQFMDDQVIALFEFEESSRGLAVSAEKHYRLVLPDQLTAEELDSYRHRAE